MLAYYFDGKPRLYKLNPLWCVPVPATSHFMTSGIASDLANYILLEHTQPGMDCDFASIIAIKAVEDAIQHVEGCGSPPRVALILDRAPTPQPNLPTLRPLPTGAPPDKVEFFKKLHGISESLFNYNTQPVVIFLPKMVASLAKTIASIEQKTKDAKNKTFHSVMRKLAKQEFNQLIKTLDKAKVTIGDATPDNPNKNP